MLADRFEILQEAHLQLMHRLGPDRDESRFPKVEVLLNLLTSTESDLSTKSPLGLDTQSHKVRSKLTNRTFDYIEEHLGESWSWLVLAAADVSHTSFSYDGLISTFVLKYFSEYLDLAFQELGLEIPDFAQKYEGAMREVLRNDFPDSTLHSTLLPPGIPE